MEQLIRVEQLIQDLNLSAESPFVLEQIIIRLAHDLAGVYAEPGDMSAERARMAAADRVRQHLDAVRGRTTEVPYGTGLEG